MEPIWFHPGAVLENGATLEGGAVFFSQKGATCTLKGLTSAITTLLLFCV